MRTLIFTGNGSAGIALAAVATASVAARQGKRTLIASPGPSHSLSALLGVPVSDTPQPIADHLDAWELDPFKRMSDYLERARPYLFGVLTRISGEELPTLPGLDLFIGLDYLQHHITEGAYDFIVIDGGPHDALLRALAAPDGFRWFLRLVFGLDREPGRNVESLNNALLPTSLIPFDSIGKIQDARVRLEQLRDGTIDPEHTTARYVLRPDHVALNEAMLAVPALQLHGLAVDSLIAGPLLPKDTPDTTIAALATQQQAVIAQAAELWSPRPIFRMPFISLEPGIDALETIGRTFYGDYAPDSDYHAVQPIERNEDAQDPFVAIKLPGLPRDELNLTISYDELVVRAGPYRRHILLPKPLRNANNIKAARKGEQLVVRLRS
jgi:anion-transporting  ArsA/GET3 family ATPase